MKIHTRELLDRLTDDLQTLGLRKVRRGRAIEKAPNDMSYGVELQEREWPDGVVTILVFAILTWESIERLVALGWGKKFRPSEAITVSKICIADRGFEFYADESEVEESRRLIDFCRETALPIARALAEPSAVENVHMNNLSTGERPPRPDIVLAILVHRGGVKVLDSAYTEVLSQTSDAVAKENLTRFWQRLRSC